MKDTQNDMKQNIQGINSDRKETRTQSNYLEQKGKINILLEQNKETRIQKNEKRLTSLWDNLKHSESELQGCLQKKNNNSKKLKTYLNK